jgi:hypothetical protein
LQKIEALKEHSQALSRHMENTSSYLHKEVQSIEDKIARAKAIVLKELGIEIREDDTNPLI